MKKCILGCLLALLMVSTAMAGEDPYISIVGPDYLGNSFYYSPKHIQFMYNENADPFFIPTTFGSIPASNQYTRVGATGQEMFRSQTLNSQVEVCDTTTPARGLKTAKTPAGNAGFYEWYVRLPKKPSGEINLVLQCAVVKPNALAVYREDAIELCAAETGERVGYGSCVRQEIDPGVNPLVIAALPKITATVYPGPYNVNFAPFKLTAFRNPGNYNVAFDAITGAMSNSAASQVLDGSANTRIVLKACMDKTIVTKLPVTGQLNAAGDTENDLEAGDLIYVRMDIPRQNTVDVYCHAQSLRVAGVGESPY